MKKQTNISSTNIKKKLYELAGGLYNAQTVSLQRNKTRPTSVLVAHLAGGLYNAQRGVRLSQNKMIQNRHRKEGWEEGKRGVKGFLPS